MDSDIVELLRQSRRQLMDVYPVIVDSDGEVLSGHHRLKAGWERRHTIDTGAMATERGVPRRVMKEVVKVHLNIQRKPGPEELGESINEAAKAFVAIGKKKGELVDELRKWFPYSRPYIRDVLSPDFKDEVKAAAGKKGAEKRENSVLGQTEHDSARTDTGKTELIEEKESIEPYSKGLSPRASEHTKKADTAAESALAVALNEWKVPFRTQVPFIREGELTSDGRQKTYTADFLIGENIVGEVEGSGSASADNEKRDEFFKAKGCLVHHFPNSLCEKWAYYVAWILKLVYDMGGRNKYDGRCEDR